MRKILILVLCTVSIAFAKAQVAIKGEMVYTVSGEPIPNGVVLIKNGKIENVGAGLAIPAGYKTYEAKVVTPGLVDARSVVGLSGALNIPVDQDQLERSGPIQPDLRAIDAYNPEETLVKVVRDNGVTTLHTGHGIGALVSGQTMVVKTKEGTPEAVALQQLNRWGAMPLPVNASCWREDRLCVRLRGAKAAVAAAQTSMGGEVLDSDAARHWTALREQAQPFFELQGEESLWRLSVPDTAAPLGLGETLVEWGGAQRWVKRPDGDAGLIREAAAQASGHATLFRSARKSVPVFSALKPPLDRIHRELKKQFDPAGVFNPGRLYADF